MLNAHLSCIVCDYRGFLVFRKITLKFLFFNGTTAKAVHAMRWCGDCHNVRHVEMHNQLFRP